jgi:biotin carboxyl carrier protein
MSKLGIKIGKRFYHVQVDALGSLDNRLFVHIEGEEIPVILPKQIDGDDKLEWIIINNRPYELDLNSDLMTIRLHNRVYPIEIRDIAASLTRPRSVDGRVKAPIPGLIRQLFVYQGMTVEAGQSLLVLEAMKMENEILSPKAGNIRSVSVIAGQNVNFNDILIEIE